MSCEIRQIASLVDLHKCRTLLFKAKDDGVDKITGVSGNWLQECLVAASPTGEILVIAKNTKLIVLTSRWDSTEVGDIKMKYSITWHGNPCPKQGEEITSILCLPLISQGQSVHGGADWTCIVVGFSSGTLSFFTETMNQLISDTLHNDPVIQIKCSSYRTPKQAATSANQESNEFVYILFKSVICTITGFSLFQTLRGCRNQLARQRASSLGDALQASVPLDFKKYSFSDQDAITDSCFVGQTSVNTFDHLVTASLVGGFHSNYRPGPPQTSLIIAAGRKPFVGFHYTVEGGGGPVLTDVALAVASKIKHSVAATIPGWFGFGNKKSSQQDKLKESVQEPAEQLGCRFGLCDLWRHGDAIIMSPDGSLLVVSDSLGRVTLIDAIAGVAVRMWKGCREAQCGFLEVEEDLPKARHKKSKVQHPNASPRHALFLVIYAPKKGLVEIFSLQQGPRVASFKVPKNGRLLYTPHGLVGFNSAPMKGVNASQCPVLFVSEEGVSDVVVPFHCALSDGTSKKARDLHVLKKMKTFLRQEEYTNAKLVEEVEKYAKELKTDEVRLQIIDMMTSNKHITTEAFKVVLDVFIKDVQSREELDQIGKNVLTLSEELERLLTFYQFVQDVNNLPPNYKTVVNPSEDDPSLPESLLYSEKEIRFVLDFIKEMKQLEGIKKRDARVGFQEKETTDLIQFLSCFDFDAFLNLTQKNNENIELNLTFKSDLNEERLRSVGEVLFKGMFCSDDWINDWKAHVRDCNLDQQALFKCLLSYWFSRYQSDNVSYEMTVLVELVKAVCSLVDPNVISISYNTPSPWWTNIQSYISSSRYVLPGLIAAVCCRAVTIFVEQDKELSRNPCDKKPIPRTSVTADDESAPSTSAEADYSTHNDWENVSQDTCQWDILITQLEDIALLNTVLSLNFKNEKSESTKLTFDFEPESLTSVLMKGRGRVSELVAKWLAQFGLNPSVMVDSSDVEFQANRLVLDKKDKRLSIGARDGISPAVDEAKEVETEPVVVFAILEHLGILKRQFPYSLTSSAVICNMCWEFMAHWYKNISDLDCLHSALQCLRVIPSTTLKYGISYLSWTTYVRQNFESVAKLINKIGKVPKEKFCLQEINLNNLQVPIFLKHVTEFLNTMIESSLEKAGDFVTNQEGIWQNDVTGATPSLVNLALSQPMANEDLLLLHYQLALSLYIISALNVKLPKVFSSLFDNTARVELFTELTKSSQVSSHYYNARLKASRQQFLYKAITGAVQTIDLVECIPSPEIAKSSDYVPGTRLNVEESTKWIRMCYDLAGMWDVPLDDLRRHHICELYSCGFDRLAEEVVPAVNECSALASQLMVVAGQRLKVFMHASTDLTEKITNLSPALTTWFDTLDSESLKSHHIILNDIAVLLAYVLKWLHEGHNDLALATAMVDAIPSLDNNN